MKKGNNNEKLNQLRIFLNVAPILLFGLTSCKAGPPELTRDNFATAETHRYFEEFTDQGAVNEFVHEATIAVALDKQTVIRSNIDMFYSHAIVDVSKGATLTLPESDGRLRLAQIIDPNHFTSDVFYEAGTYELKSNSGAEFVYIFMRTGADPADSGDQAKARAIMEGASITSEGARSFTSEFGFDTDEIVAMRVEIIREATYTNSIGCFGDVDEIQDFDHFTFCSANGWGGLPEAHAVYKVEKTNMGIGCATMTIDPPPVDYYWSLTVYDAEGWLAHPYPLRTSDNTTPNTDGTLTFNFGCGEDALNNIDITENWSYALRMYGPQEPILNGTYQTESPHPVE